MFKKYMVILLALLLCAGVFAGCSYEGAPTDLKKPNESVEDITKYLNESTNDYVTIAPLSLAKESITAKINDGTLTTDDAIFDAYTDLCGNGAKDLPEALVNHYVNAMKAEGEEDTTALTEKAKQLIKEEMIVYLAFLNVDELKNLSFNNEVRAAAAEDLAAKFGNNYTFTPDLDSSEYYAIDSYIKQQLIIAYLKGEAHEYLELCKPAADEESSEATEFSAVSEETVESSEDTESVDSSVESVEESAEVTVDSSEAAE